MKLKALLTVLTIGLLPHAAFGQSSSFTCDSETDGFLASIGLGEDQIQTQTRRTERVGRRGGRGRVVAHHTWVRPKSCGGHLVITMNAGCQITNTFTTEDCGYDEVDHAE